MRQGRAAQAPRPRPGPLAGRGASDGGLDRPHGCREDHRDREDSRSRRPGDQVQVCADYGRYIPGGRQRPACALRKNHGVTHTRRTRSGRPGRGHGPQQGRGPGPDRHGRAVEQRIAGRPDRVAAHGAQHPAPPGAVGGDRWPRAGRGGAPLQRHRARAVDLHQAGRGRRPGQHLLGGGGPAAPDLVRHRRPARARGHSPVTGPDLVRIVFGS